MFQGFSDQTIDFLWGVRFNNNREWMNEHKQEYRQVLLQPMTELAGEVHGQMADRYPDARLQLHVSRIYRDARRLHGRGPLKENLWFSLFGNREIRTHRPEFFFELTPEGYSFGLGVWSARAEDMQRFRASILAEPAPLTALAERFAGQELFRLEGDEYVRSMGQVSDLLRPWFQKKNFCLFCQRKYDRLVTSPALVGQLVEGFCSLMPYYDYFNAI